jgi:DNA primase
MNVRQLLSAYNIPFVTEGNKHCTAGWINIHCPFCAGSQDFHLGIHEEGTAANCWRCGGHSMVQVLQKLLNIDKAKAYEILKKYGGRARTRIATEAKVSIFPLKLPTPNGRLAPYYKKYLENRGFDAEYLEKEWGLLQTGPISFLDDISFSHRILIPIYWNGEMVSFQGRDITGKSKWKYLACPKRREKIDLKTIVYGKETHWASSPALIITEGVTDVWRLGPSSVATFGIQFKIEQVLALSKIHDKFFIVFDNETEAQKQAKSLAVKLKTLGKKVHIEKVEDDPGSMKQEEADYLVKQLLRKEGR